MFAFTPLGIDLILHGRTRGSLVAQEKGGVLSSSQSGNEKGEDLLAPVSEER
jgi:hypothetical protein